jgi:hypothetical protein
MTLVGYTEQGSLRPWQSGSATAAVRLLRHTHPDGGERFASVGRSSQQPAHVKL